ncbi:hypothetical protein AA313_de0206643 [Arthrobotrys entomopaga]|nr:hypothetical protein AA313_de0206643 [Arthrobotrys entomopaga]
MIKILVSIQIPFLSFPVWFLCSLFFISCLNFPIIVHFNVRSTNKNFCIFTSSVTYTFLITVFPFSFSLFELIFLGMFIWRSNLFSFGALKRRVCFRTDGFVSGFTCTELTTSPCAFFFLTFFSPSFPYTLLHRL